MAEAAATWCPSHESSAPSCLLLDDFTVLRSRQLEEAQEHIGKKFSPHRLSLHGAAQGLDVSHNQVRLRELTLNILRYGADIEIESDERDNFYMLQLPLRGHARLYSQTGEQDIGAGVLSVLQPRMHSRMSWSDETVMLTLQVPTSLLHERATQWGFGRKPRPQLVYYRQSLQVAALWQATMDLVHNIDRLGIEWVRYPAICASLEDFLLSSFAAIVFEADAKPVNAERGDERCIRRAKDFIHAHLDRALSLSEIASHACVSPRTLEAAFRRLNGITPLLYARHCRLQAVHEALCAAGRSGRGVRITELAMAHGFFHMSRFAAQYRERFGYSPSETGPRFSRAA